jgi:hypothetical protein
VITQDGQGECLGFVNPLEDFSRRHRSIVVRSPHQPLLSIIKLDAYMYIVGTSKSGTVERDVDHTGMAGSESFSSLLDGFTIEILQAVIELYGSVI